MRTHAPPRTCFTLSAHPCVDEPSAGLRVRASPRCQFPSSSSNVFGLRCPNHDSLFVFRVQSWWWIGELPNITRAPTPEVGIPRSTVPTDHITVLIVDDDPGFLKAAHRLLSKGPYTLLSAGDPLEGLRLLGKHSVDLLVSDSRMPAMPGLEFLAMASACRPGVRRVLMSGQLELQSADEALRSGAIHDVLNKPWALDDFVAMQRRVFAKGT